MGRSFRRGSISHQGFDSLTGSPTGLVISGLQNPQGVAYASDTETLYVVESRYVRELDRKSNRLRAFSAVTGQPTGFVIENLRRSTAVVYDSVHQILFVTEFLEENSRVRAFSAKDGRPTNVPANPDRLTWDVSLEQSLLKKLPASIQSTVRDLALLLVFDNTLGEAEWNRIRETLFQRIDEYASAELQGNQTAQQSFAWLKERFALATLETLPQDEIIENLLHLLRWINAYLLLPNRISLIVFEGRDITPEEDPTGPASRVRLMDAPGYELFLLPESNIPITAVYTTTLDSFGYAWRGIAYIRLEPSIHNMEITRAEEISHVSDDLRFGLGKRAPESLDELYEPHKIPSGSGLRNFLRTVSRGDVDIAKAILMEIRAQLRELASPGALEAYQLIDSSMQAIASEPEGFLRIVNESRATTGQLAIVWLGLTLGAGVSPTAEQLGQVAGRIWEEMVDFSTPFGLGLVRIYPSEDLASEQMIHLSEMAGAGLEEKGLTRRKFFRVVTGAAVGATIPSLIPGRSEAKPTTNPPIARQFQGEVVVDDLVVGQPMSPQLLRLEIAAHETLLGSIQNNFRGTPIRSVSIKPEQATEDLKDFTVQDQVYRMAVLDKMLLGDPAQVAEILPSQHAPTFLLYGVEANLLTPAVAAAILKLQLPANGLFLLRLRQDDLGQVHLAVYA